MHKKRICHLLVLVLAIIMIGSCPADAQKKKKTTKSQTTFNNTPANIQVGKNYEGFPDPTGHTYKRVGNGVTIILTFDSRHSATATYTYKKNKTVESLGWEQDRNVLRMPEFIFIVSEDGRILTDTETGASLYIVK